jgi:hypothetical protein
MPHTLNAQQPSGEHKQTDQYQPLKPQWLNFPMGIFIFQALEKRLQLKLPCEKRADDNGLGHPHAQRTESQVSLV